ncbi:hypothetical protein [Haloplanus natans]|uniref:hypothetical protein n=1 Tax=Haloplanus natans TaxID=376171 RepID=UPI0006782A00|nr:hypothetical protein [Haloplanus natans]
MTDTDTDEMAGLEASLEEARRFLDEQLSSIDNVDGKAIQLFQVVTVLVGLLLSLLSFVYGGRAADALQLLNPVTLAGIAVLVGAMAAAAITYSTGEYHAGIGPEDLRWIATGGYEDGEFRRGLYDDLLLGYADWIEANQRANERQGVFITVTILAIIYGVALLAVGVATALLPALSLPFAAVLAVVLVGITRLLGPIGQLRILGRR